MCILHLVEAVYDVTLGFKKGEPSLLGVMNGEPCDVDILARYAQDRYFLLHMCLWSFQELQFLKLSLPICIKQTLFLRAVLITWKL